MRCAANSSELACVLQVSIVDAVLLHHFSVAVPLELRRGAALAFLPGAHTYVPLLSFHAEVQLAYFDGAGPVFLVITDTVLLPTAGATAVVLRSSLQLVEPDPEIDCSRYAGHNSNSSVCLFQVQVQARKQADKQRRESAPELFSEGLEDDLVLGGALLVADAFAVYRWSPERRLWIPVRVQVMMVDAYNHRGWDPGRDFWRSLRLSEEAPFASA